MQDASAGDFQGAIGAALAANDKGQAEQWLRQALERFPRDPSILTLAARYEQARGDNQRAADFYRASLAAMPSASPAEKLAHVLVYPDQDTRARRVVTAADLQHLLDPDYEPFAKTAKIPPLPAYGADPYNGSAPVVIAPRRQAAQAPAEQHLDPSPQLDLPQLSPSSSTQAPQQSTPVYVPQAWHRPTYRRLGDGSSSLGPPWARVRDLSGELAGAAASFLRGLPILSLGIADLRRRGASRRAASSRRHQVCLQRSSLRPRWARLLHSRSVNRQLPRQGSRLTLRIRRLPMRGRAWFFH